VSKITNDGLTRSDTGCYIAVPYGYSGRRGVGSRNVCLTTALTRRLYHLNCPSVGLW